MFLGANAQDPQLFENTWHLRTVMLDDMTDEYVVSEINPPIAPYLIISEDFDFNGAGACNTFNGTYNFYPPNDLITLDFFATADGCGGQEYDRFEEDYFWFISHEFWFDISQDSEGKVLTLGTPLGGVAVFKSNPLSTKDFYKNELNVYPNPVNDVLILDSKEEIGNLTIKIFNIEGKLLSIQNLNMKKQVSVDVSSLSSGIYFLNIEDEKGNTTIKKFLKE